MNDVVKISVCIIAGNEEENIRRCLESVKWADEIVVVNNFSDDSTVSICQEYTDRVFQHRWTGYVGQKSIVRNLARNEWVLFVDADEVVSTELYNEIYTTFKNGVDESIDGFEFPRMVWFLNRWIRHGDWYPDSKLRLFRKKRGRCCGHEPHEKIEVLGKVKHLKSPLYHYTYDDISDQLNTLNRFSSIGAHSVRSVRRSNFRALTGMLFRAPFRFIRCYFIKFGFLDGLPGLIIAIVSSFGVFAKYAKFWELNLPKNNK